MTRHLFTKPRGFTLFIALIMTAVILSVGLALLNVSYKQVILASTTKNSALSFYHADSGIECALFWDSKLAFDYTAPLSPHTINCDGTNITFTVDDANPAQHIRTFTIPCPTSGYLASVQIYKANTGRTTLYSNGYDTCDPASRTRTERGIKARY